MKRSGMREQQLPASFPHFAALHAGYAFREPLVVLGGIVVITRRDRLLSQQEPGRVVLKNKLAACPAPQGC
ncbi:MAG: hypothetical protein ACYC1F_02620 [Gallionellaceae bacterium]